MQPRDPRTSAHAWWLFWVVLLVLGACAGRGPNRPPTVQLPPYLTHIARVPVDVHRRAAQLLEELRGAPAGLDAEAGGVWEHVELWPYVTLMHRPDVRDVAYYEFALVDPRSVPFVASAEERLAQGAAAFRDGFIVVSAGEHDVPIPHYAHSGASITARLVSFAKARGDRVYTVLKLDSVTYAAEDHRSRLLAAIVPGFETPQRDLVPLPRVVGMEMAWLEREARLSESWSVVTQAGRPIDTTGLDDDQAALWAHRIESSDLEEAPWRLLAWPSWSALRSGYASSYAVLLAALARDAARLWDVERMVAAAGEGIAIGRVHAVPVLHEPYVFELRGSAVDAVEVETAARAGRPDVLLLRAVTPLPDSELELHLWYPEFDRRETLRFFTVGATRVATSSATPWGAWSTSYAQGGDAAQRRYWQFETPGEKCVTGCGSTAWAMLFGWADHLAGAYPWSGERPWIWRYGIYRVNGGTGANAIAPLIMDQGIKYVTLEIREAVESFCVGKMAATWPWKMANAAAYLDGRTGAQIQTTANRTGIATDRIRDLTRDRILDEGAVVVGTGFLQHYPVAYGYRVRERVVKKLFGLVTKVETQQDFVLNQGGGELDHEWVTARTWFFGTIYPNAMLPPGSAFAP